LKTDKKQHFYTTKARNRRLGKLTEEHQLTSLTGWVVAWASLDHLVGAGEQGMKDLTIVAPVSRPALQHW
jgi:hypothetical protein